MHKPTLLFDGAAPLTPQPFDRALRQALRQAQEGPQDGAQDKLWGERGEDGAQDERHGSVQATILLVVNDESMMELLLIGLQDAGFRVLTAADGHRGLNLARAAQPDLVLLDVMLPRMNGFAVCRTLRRESAVPIILLSSLSQEEDRVRGLEMGADDYVVKPCSPSLRLGPSTGSGGASGQRFRELLARVRALLRRRELNRGYASPPNGRLVVGEIVLDRRAHRVWHAGRPVKLRKREFDLLGTLMELAGKAVPRHELLDRVWGEDWIGDPRTLDVHICWLREKLGDEPSAPRYIQTIHGYGYRFIDPAALHDGRPITNDPSTGPSLRPGSGQATSSGGASGHRQRRRTEYAIRNTQHAVSARY